LTVTGSSPVVPRPPATSARSCRPPHRGPPGRRRRRSPALQQQRGPVGQHFVVPGTQAAKRIEPGITLGGDPRPLGHPVERRGHHFQEQRLLRPENAEHVRLGDLSPAGDRLGRGPVQAAVGELPRRDLQDLLPALGPAHPLSAFHGLDKRACLPRRAASRKSAVIQRRTSFPPLQRSGLSSRRRPMETPTASCATALAIALASEVSARLGVCAAPHCDRVYVDTSRNGSRRFCSAACQSRVKAAAFRARRA
jgi:hypothetical protein